VDPFAPRSFSRPEAGGQPAKPQKPVAPPLPFRYLGKMIEDGKLNVFLARGDESLAVRAGQKLGEYRVDKVTDSEIVFTYLPLKTKQSLPL
jgi:Tfp pilus assembly protein PilP